MNRQLVDAIDAERERLARRGQRAARLIAGRARRAALSALQRDDDPAQAVRAVLLGTDRRPGELAQLLADGMVAAHLSGRRRSHLIAAPKMRARTRYKLAGSAYDDAIDFLKRVTEASAEAIERLRRKYLADAANVVKEAVAPLQRRITRAITEATKQGLGVRDGVRALREAFAAEGMDAVAGYRLEGIFRTQTQMAYGAGRWNSLQDPAIQEILWGFEYVTVGDDRVRPAHAAMEGVIRPKDDPIWRRWTPPNGWNCRCTLLEIYDEGEPTEVPNVRPDPGFAFNPGEVYRDLIGAE